MKELLKKVKKVFGAEPEEPATTGAGKLYLPGKSGNSEQDNGKNSNSAIPEPATIRALREAAYMPGGGKSVVTPVPDKVPAPLPAEVQKKAVKESALPPASRKRDEILRFIIHGLRPYTNEKYTGIKGISLFILCKSREEENLVNVALYADRPKFFQQDVLERKLSDNYISPDPHWLFEFTVLRDALPDCQVSNGVFAMNVIKEVTVNGKSGLATITILSGQAEKADYILDPAIKLKYKIGRGANPALPSGMQHNNDIAFYSREDAGFDETKGAANLTVSRYHAMIIYNPEQKKFYIAADHGGTPDSGNKTKLFSENGKLTRLDIAGALHILSDGDQVELGGSARLLVKLTTGLH